MRKGFAFGLLVAIMCFGNSSFGQVVYNEGFEEGGVFPPPGWSLTASGGGYTWNVATIGAVDPPCNPHTGSYMAEWNSFTIPSGQQGLLISPVVDYSARGGVATTVTAWIYRDDYAYTGGYAAEGINVYINTTAAVAGGVSMGFVPRNATVGTTGGVTGTSAPGVSGWYQYTFTVPTTYNTATNYIIFDGISRYGDNCYMDDIQWTAYPPTCSGTPTGGTASASTTTVCPSLAFTLDLTGYSATAGITFQWQSSTTGTTWTNLAGATTTSYTTTETAGSYYQCLVTCTASALTAVSSSVYVGYSPLCYCTPQYYDYTTFGDAAYTYGIGNFYVTGYGGSLINDNGPTTLPPDGYEDRTMDTVNMQVGNSYPGTITYNPAYEYYENEIWIDFNNDGIFQASEAVTGVFGAGGCTTTESSDAFTAIIPLGSATGYHRMRVRNAMTFSCTNSTAMDPCNDDDATNDYYYGTTRDYIVDIFPTCTFTASASNSGPVCPNSTLTLTGATTAPTYSWSGPGGFSSTVLSPTFTATNSGTYILTATNGTCTLYENTSVSFFTALISPTVTPSSASICNGSSVMLTATTTTVNLFPVESWESGVPTTAGTAVDGWNYIGATSGYWFQTQGAAAINPTIGGAESGNYVAEFGSYSIAAGQTASLYSPSFSMTGISGATLTFWVYRDVSAYNSGAYNAEGITVYINTTPATAGATSLGTVPRRGGRAITGPLTGTSTTATSGWYEYTVAIPVAFTGTANYILFYAKSEDGDNIYLDNVALVGTESAPTWSPSTYLYTNAGFTIPYTTGTATDIVYVYPTTVVTPTVIDYTASITNGICASTATSIVTINPLPSAISGIASACIGNTTSLSDGIAGGTWSTTAGSGSISLSGTSGTVNTVTGLTSGTATVTYSTGGNCYSTRIVTVTASPGVITGTTTVCSGLTTALTNGTTGGTWSETNGTGTATVGSTGNVTGGAAGTVTISYSTSPGCYASTTVTVTGSPGSINGGTIPICGSGSTTTLSDGTAGGTWSSSNTSVATVGSTGTTTTVTVGSGTGIVTITYSMGGSCYAITTVTVNAAPISGTINGSGSVCAGATTNLTDITASGGTGTWSSNNTSVGTVGSTTGTVYGVSPGSTIISYTETSLFCGSATTTTNITVNASPIAGTINGLTSVCTGSTIMLSNATASGGTGTWSSSNPGVGSVDPASGIVTGISGGTTMITYTETSASCGSLYTTMTVTVNASPGAGAITGLNVVCVGATTTLADPTASSGTGTWSSSNVAVGTVGATTGVVYGVSPGTTIITYTETSVSCGSVTTTTNMTVNVSPIVGTITGLTSVCTGSTITLSDATASGGTGAWISSNPGVGSVDPALGIVTGISSGTTMITYTETSASCGSLYTTITVTVNASPNAGLITGSNTLCVGLTTTLADLTASGGTGTWSSSNTAVGTVGSTTGTVYGVSSGTTIISYTETSLFCGSATTTANMTVNVSPIAGTITGPGVVCTGLTITLSNATSSGGTGAWTSSIPTVGTVGATTGVVYGVSGGTTMITFTETSASCGSLYTTMTITVNVSPNAGLITGPNTLCAGLTTTLADLTASGGTGTWSSSNTAIGTVGSTTGTVYGVSPGTTIISYTETSLYCGSATTTTNMTVNVSPIAGTITGLTSVCTGSTITLSDATVSGGTGAWSSSNPTAGTIGATGIVYGVSGGTTMITFTETSASCGSAFTTTIVTVNESPNAGAIVGAGPVCVGSTLALTNPSASGGTGAWSSSNTTIGTVGSTTGVVYGVSPGTTIIDYTETSLYCGSATATANVLVIVSPVAGTITGSGTVCTGLTVSLSDATASGGAGVWTSSNTPVGTVGATTGVVYGVSGGTTIITFTETSASCGSAFTTTIVTVNVSLNAGAIVGAGPVCQGLTLTLTNPSASGGAGAWSSSNTTVGTVGSATGVVYGVSPGTTVINYTETSLYCGSSTTTANVLVNVSPIAGTITGPGTVCTGLTITLSDATALGGTGVWTSSNTPVGTVGATTGVVYGVSGGTTTITFTETSASCGSAFTTTIVTVNVSPNAGAIVGAGPVCQGLTLALTNPSASSGAGAWSSSNTAVGTVGSTTGTVYGVSQGTTTISYTETSLYCGSATTTANMTVNVSPVAGTITGLNTVCTGLTITLSDATASGGTGAWTSSNPAAGTVGATGIVYGVSGGTTMITFTETSASCGSVFATTIVTVNVSPNAGAIVGAGPVCQGLTLTLTNPSASGGTGAWSSSNTTVGTIGSTTGVVYGVSPGTTVINYTETSLYCGSASTTANVLVNVSPVAGTITGPGTVCTGLTITLSDATASGGTGTWTSSIPAVGTVGATTGVVYGVSGGTTMITFTETSASCGSAFTTTIVTVNVSPNAGAIIGAGPVCQGLTLTLTNPSASGGTGVWSSSNTTIGTIGSTTGVVYGVSPGTTVINYTETSLYCGSASTTANVLVNVSPVAGTITGPGTVCSGLTITLSDATASGGTGAWTSSIPTVGTVGATTGIVYGVSGGTTMITFTETSASCGSVYTTTIVTVNVSPNAGAIIGAGPVCVGSSLTLTNPSASGGTGLWSSSNTTVGTVGSTTGVVYGVSPGTTIIDYTETSLYCGSATTTANVVVNVSPSAGTITGTANVCVGLTITLSDATASGGTGTWSSSNAPVGTVGSTTGVVYGVSSGTTMITFTETSASCGSAFTTMIVTVNANPTTITGTTNVCVGLTTALNSSPAGGTWSSSNGNAAINATTGVVTGANPGTSTITYVLNTGCLTSTPVTVNANPTTITGTLSVCSGSTTILNSTPAGGTWSSSNAGVAAVNGTNGTVSGGSVAVTTTATITYTLPTGCIITAIVTVNPLPAVITGTLDVCAGLTTTLADASTPGTWSSNATGIATIGVTSGVVTGVSAGTSTIIFVLPTGCQTTAVVTVNPLPGSILGVSSVCQGSTTSLSDVSAGGTWSSSNALVATVSTGGIVTGTATGAAALTATITYTLPTGCIITDIVTVNPLPAAIMGTLDVCSGLSSTLTDATSGGTWSSSATGTASIILTTGVMTGGTAGTATITYKLLGTGCIATAVATVNPLPTSILGTLKVCSGLTTLLSDLTTGGTWSSSAPAIAAVGSSTGIVTGESVTVTGESIITYTLPTGCIATAVATVNPLPGTIEGIPTVCLGLKTYLSDATPGGAWSSSNTNAIISSTGVVTGNNVGTSTITYTLSTGCIMTATVTVNPLPASITGTLNVCVHDTVQLSDVSTGGTWSSSNATIGSAGSVSGEVTGVSPGTATITYTLSTGCISTAVMTVNPQPDAIHGVASVCYGSSTSLSDSTVGGVWSSSSNLTASVGTSGAVTAEGVGTATISYTLAAGCSAFDVVTVNPLPSVFTVTPTGGTYCEGGSGDPIGLNGSQVGVSYLLYYDSSVAGYLAGTGLPLNFGLLTVAGTYTVRATNSTTGCISGMFGTAQIIITPTVNPVVSVVSLSGDTVCPGTSVLFTPDTLHAGASPTYKWFVNGVLVSTTANYTYIPANGDVVSVTLTSDGICVEPSTASGSLAMVVLPDAPPGVSISIYPGDTVCQYSVATFTATPTFGGPAPEYIWYVNGIQQTGGGQEFSYYPATGDIVYCKVVSDYRCRLADTGYSNSAVMTVTPMTVPHVEIMAGSGFIIEAGQTDSLWAVVSNAGPSPTYQWAVDGVTIPGATQAYYISQFNNYDSVTCTVTSSGACDGISAFDWIFITVYSTGVQQFSTGSGDIRLMPNPNNGVFTLKGTLGTAMAEEVTIEVTDMMGQVVYSGKVQTSGGRINEQIALGGSLANGMYLLNLQSGSDNKVFHFVIEK